MALNLSNAPSRIRVRLRRQISMKFARRCLSMRSDSPLVSFTFDDFPRSALLRGGEILRSHGSKGTFFASFGLMNQVGPTGEIFSTEDLAQLMEQQHELGCHTFDHFNAWETAPADFEASILRNRRAGNSYLPQWEAKTFSYPISCPRPAIKRLTGEYFVCCRGGGQTFNSGNLDLNFLAGFFIEQSRDHFDNIERVIAQNTRERGWLIFATHDVSETPTRFGCTPRLLEAVVRCAVASGASILSMSEAIEALLRNVSDKIA